MQLIKPQPAKRAIREYQEAIKINPDYTLVWRNLGNVYLEILKCEQAWQVQKQLGAKADSDFVQNLQQKCPK